MTKDVFRIPEKTWWVKFSPEHGWGCDTGSGPLWFQGRGNFMPLLPLLELKFEAAKRMVDEGVQGADLSLRVADAFPYEDVIVYALDWETESWPTDAIVWLEEGFPMNGRIVTLLRKISEKRHFHQRTRHQAIALVRQLERENV
jgi:hypothetical protein